MRIIITGAKASLGQALIHTLAHHELVVFDRKELDITQENLVHTIIAQVKPQLVINCAAYNAVDAAEVETETAFKVNTRAVGYLSNASALAGSSFVHVSTNYVFDGTHPGGYTENDIPNPQSVYAKSKRGGELEAKKYNRKSFILRTAWLYGEAGGSLSSKKNFVQTMLDLSKEKTDISCVADQYAQPTFTYDLAECVRYLITNALPSGTYHVTNSGEASWYSWAKEIFAIAGSPVRLTPTAFADYKRAAQRPQYGVLQNTKLPPLRPWQEALRAYMKTLV